MYIDEINEIKKCWTENNSENSQVIYDMREIFNYIDQLHANADRSGRMLNYWRDLALEYKRKLDKYKSINNRKGG